MEELPCASACRFVRYCRRQNQCRRIASTRRSPRGPPGKKGKLSGDTKQASKLGETRKENSTGHHHHPTNGGPTWASWVAVAESPRCRDRADDDRDQPGRTLPRGAPAREWGVGQAARRRACFAAASSCWTALGMAGARFHASCCMSTHLKLASSNAWVTAAAGFHLGCLLQHSYPSYPIPVRAPKTPLTTSSASSGECPGCKVPLPTGTQTSRDTRRSAGQAERRRDATSCRRRRRASPGPPSGKMQPWTPRLDLDIQPRVVNLPGGL